MATISSLGAATEVYATDEFILARSSTTKKITGHDLVHGWIADTATWTYASASTFTVSGDRTAVFSKGTRLRFTQTTVKYAVVIGSSHAAGTTTVTIAVNNDYTIANAAITVTSYSYVVNPTGYPGWYAFTPTYTGFSANPSAGSARYNIMGTMIVFEHLQNTGTSNATGFTVTMPVTARDTNSHVVGRVYNSGVFAAGAGLIAITASSATLDLFRDGAGATWTNSGAKTMGFTITVEF
jgi:hypothetical protein